MFPSCKWFRSLIHCECSSCCPSIVLMEKRKVHSLVWVSVPVRIGPLWCTRWTMSSIWAFKFGPLRAAVGGSTCRFRPNAALRLNARLRTSNVHVLRVNKHPVDTSAVTEKSEIFKMSANENSADMKPSELKQTPQSSVFTKRMKERRWDD